MGLLNFAVVGGNVCDVVFGADLRDPLVADDIAKIRIEGVVGWDDDFGVDFDDVFGSVAYF